MARTRPSWREANDLDGLPGYPDHYLSWRTFFEPYPEKIEQPTVPDNYSAQRYEGGMVRPISDRYAKKLRSVPIKWARTRSRH